MESGLRINDILTLKVGDLIYNPMTIYETKSKRQRVIAISPKLENQLRDYCAGRSNDAYVFQSSRNPSVHINRSTFYRQIKKACKWLAFDCSAHSARKLFAQNVLAETGSIEAVRRALNHTKITTTATYLDIDLEMLVKEMKI